MGIPLESPQLPAEAQQGSGGPIQGAQHALPGGHQEVPRMPYFGGETIWCTCKKSLGNHWQNMMFICCIILYEEG